jgi:hypothetical protein
MHQILKFILFSSRTLHISEGLSVHLQESKTVHPTSGICQTDTAFPLASSQQNLFDMYVMQYVQSYTPVDGRKDRSKHVECY